MTVWWITNNKLCNEFQMTFKVLFVSVRKKGLYAVTNSWLRLSVHWGSFTFFPSPYVFPAFPFKPVPRVPLPNLHFLLHPFPVIAISRPFPSTFPNISCRSIQFRSHPRVRQNLWKKYKVKKIAAV